MAAPKASRGSAADPALQIDLEDRGSTLVLRVSGSAAADVADQLAQALQHAAQQRSQVLAIDVSGLTFISSTGLGGLVAAHVTCQKNGTRLFLIDPQPFLVDILQITRLNSLFKVCQTLEEAEQQARGG